MQLPFLQSVLDTFTLVPLAVGYATPDDVAAVLDALWGGPETLIVVSSDLSHYHAYADARRIDRETADAVLALSPNLDHDQACGATPINGLAALCAAPRARAGAARSAQLGRHRRRPVARCRLCVVRLRGPWNATLTWATCCSPSRARRSGASSASARPRRPDHASLAAPAATFVTLRRGDLLRGCIGSVEPRRSLGEDVRANAVAAAFHDPRFPPLAAHEFAETAIEVSLLGPSEPFPCANEDDAASRLQPGIDGVILHCGRHRATFLPQVWQQVPDPREFLVALKRKAGLPADGWNNVTLARYTVSKYSERARWSN